ncbi:hypothetical protein DVH24_027100 [Malus domestica]|uniref:Uncharacterized protein n=1 Tax=Malus domestica TaxID=3750 RepID=A0A498IRV9_MALDO|nr:hypothetical protein DVH24_027100 [Malus domestica]
MALKCHHWYSHSRPPSMVAAQPQGESFTTSDNAMTLGIGEQYIKLRYLTDYYHGELAHVFQHTMLLLNQACLLDRFCGGVVRVVLQRDKHCHHRAWLKKQS